MMKSKRRFVNFGLFFCLLGAFIFLVGCQSMEADGRPKPTLRTGTPEYGKPKPGLTTLTPTLLEYGRPKPTIVTATPTISPTVTEFPSPTITIRPTLTFPVTVTPLATSLPPVPVTKTGTPTLAELGVGEHPLPLDIPRLDRRGKVCFGHDTQGVSCLDSNGWMIVNTLAPKLKWTRVVALVSCDNGLYAALDNQLLHLMNNIWQPIKTDFDGFTALACKAGQGLWAAHNTGISHYDGEKWDTYSLEVLLGKEATFLPIIKDIAVTDDGQVWALATKTLFHFQNNSWENFDQEKDWSSDISLTKIGLSKKGYPWVGTLDRLLAWDGGAWREYMIPGGEAVEALYIDNHENAWVGTLNGLYLLENGKWYSYTMKKDGLSSNHIYQIAQDASGRLWVGTEWGVNVYSEMGWRTYHMHSAGMASNTIVSMTVEEEGPNLPELETRETGSVTGFIYKNGSPLENARVEVCVEKPIMHYYTQPCAGQPLSGYDVTDWRGKFTISNLPNGFYWIYANLGGGDWVDLGRDSTAPLPVVVDPQGLASLGVLRVTGNVSLHTRTPTATLKILPTFTMTATETRTPIP